MSDRKERQHFVPVMYYQNFYSQVDDVETNAKKGFLACYRMPEQNLFPIKAKMLDVKDYYMNIAKMKN